MYNKDDFNQEFYCDRTAESNKQQTNKKKNPDF